MATVILTERDKEILRILTHRLPLMSIRQVGRTWWKSEQDRSASARLRRLAQEGLVEVKPVMAHPEILLEAPILRWLPGDREPDFGSVAYRLKARWTMTPISTPLTHATHRCASMLGGDIGGRGPRPSEATHDLHLAQVYLGLRKADPGAAKRWCSERELYAQGRGRNERLPDAIIHEPGRGETPARIIEFGGAYSKAKLADFHREFADLPYEVW